MTEGENAPKLSLRVRTAGALLILTMLGGGLPILGNIFGYPFLPSKEYYSNYAIVSYVISLAVGLGSLALFSNTDIESRLAASQKRKLPSSMERAALVLFAPFFFGFLAHSLVICGIPMAAAIIAGEDVALRYTVEDASGWSERKCPNDVILADLPFLFDKICGVTDDIRNQLKPGTQIDLAGRGMASGLFYDRIAIVAGDGGSN